MNPEDRDQLLIKYLNGTLADDEIEQVEGLLLNDPTAANRLAELSMLECMLVEISQREKQPLEEDSLLAVTRQLEEYDLELSHSEAGQVDVTEIQRLAEWQLQEFLAEQEELRRQQQYAQRRYPWFSFDLDKAAKKVQTFASFTKKAVVVTTALIVVGLVIMAGILRVHKYILAHQVVACLDDAVNAKWAENEVSMHTGIELRRGWLRLEEGFAQIVFKQGAEVILQAPCQIRLNSAKRMYLESGTVTAKVPAQAQGFTIDTPMSQMIDFGTELGVNVDISGQAELHVFKGEVGLRSSLMSRSTGLQKVKGGQAAKVDTAGHINVSTIESRPRLFVRRLPDADQLGIPGRRLNLADIVGGGNGFGTGIAVEDRGYARGTINPFTGKINEPMLPDYAKNSGAAYSFLPVPELLFVDGIFIPDHRGEGCVVSSKGHLFSQCPDTNGNAMMNIANGWNLQAREKTPRTWSEAHGISMHANLGLTFDLQAMRDVMPGIEIIRFTTRAGIPLSSRPDVSDADIWVLVDGEVRFTQKAVRPPQMVDMDIPLAPRERFLTLIVTDGLVPRGGAKKPSAWDWCFFAEPTLELEASHEIP